MQQEEQQDRPAPQVIVIQQPVMVDSRSLNRCNPYLQRGVKFSNGCRCPGFLFILAGTFGFFFLYVGLIITFVIGNGAMAIGIILILVGAVGAISCCRLCHMARRDYNALPPDHPDRIKYSGVGPLPVQVGGTTTTYQFPPGTQVVSYPPSAAVQALGYQGSPGQAAGHPPSSGGQTLNPSAPAASAVHTNNDLPPSYEDAITKTHYT
ncbi:uncharacterized protein [Panulirus ornatus]|uniref:uncharacterized protein isoform X5 n=1 Tax=Panulirus ornatus TaxID=150431 RepID=UPI003A8A23ED